MNTTTKHAVAFLRVRHLTKDGPDAAVENRLIAHQRAACAQVAKRLNATIVREYVEHGGTGNIARRPQLRLMLDELLALRDATYVIAEKPDRIARQAKDLNAVHLELETSGATLVTARDETALDKTTKGDIDEHSAHQ